MAVHQHMWTPDEEQLVAECYATVGATALASRLDRSPLSIRRKAEALKIKYDQANRLKTTSGIQWTPDMDATLIALWDYWKPYQIRAKMGCHRILAGDIIARAMEIGLAPRPNTKPGPKGPPPSCRNKLTKKIMPNGMIQIAPGHVTDANSYELIMRAIGQHTTQTEPNGSEFCSASSSL
jgi:hypothetical protein